MRKKAYFWGIAAAVLLLDQAVKYVVQLKLFPLKSVTIGKYLSISYVRNWGAAFGIFPGQRVALIIVSLLVCAVVLYFHYRLSHKEYLFQSSLALILGGSIGNLSDRVFRSFVIDYVDLKFWPAFNIADVAVNVGIMVIIYRLVMKKEVL